MNSSDRRIIKSKRFFQSEKSASYTTEKFGSTQKPKSFLHDTIKLSCVGTCGSPIMDFLIENTNLKYYKDENLPVVIDICEGRGPRHFFEKLYFQSKETEETFVELIVDLAKLKIETMGYFTLSYTSPLIGID